MERRNSVQENVIEVLAAGAAGSGWRDQLRQAVRDPDVLVDLLELPEELRSGARTAAELFSLVVPHAFLSRMRRGDPNDPLLRQVLPIDAEVLALTALNAYRPRRWRGALLPMQGEVRFEVLEPEKRPVMADADSHSFNHVTHVDISTEPQITHRLLFDPGHGLEERLISEQFV